MLTYADVCSLHQVSVSVEDSKSYFEGGRNQGGEQYVYDEGVAWVEQADLHYSVSFRAAGEVSQGVTRRCHVCLVPHGMFRISLISRMSLMSLMSLCRSVRDMPRLDTTRDRLSRWFPFGYCNSNTLTPKFWKSFC